MELRLCFPLPEVHGIGFSTSLSGDRLISFHFPSVCFLGVDAFTGGVNLTWSPGFFLLPCGGVLFTGDFLVDTTPPDMLIFLVGDVWTVVDLLATFSALKQTEVKTN